MGPFPEAISKQVYPLSHHTPSLPAPEFCNPSPPSASTSSRQRLRCPDSGFLILASLSLVALLPLHTDNLQA